MRIASLTSPNLSPGLPACANASPGWRSNAKRWRMRPLCRGNCSSLLAVWRTLPPNSTTVWRPPTGRANGTSSGRWSSGWKWPGMTSMLCFVSIRTLAMRTPKKKVCNFVGGVVSPLLANIYLDAMDKSMESKSLKLSESQRSRRREQGKGNFLYVRYADDFVVLCNGTKAAAQDMKEALKTLLAHMGLTLSEEKTKLTHIPPHSPYKKSKSFISGGRELWVGYPL